MTRTNRTRTTSSKQRRIIGVLHSATTGVFALAFALAMVFALTGCSEPAADDAAKSEAPAAPASVTITDDASRTVTVEGTPERIVSLAPANTEILFALGLGDKVVGVTTYDDYPAEVKDLPKVGDFVTPNVEAIAAAKPDLIVATTGVQGDALAKLEEIGAPVLAFDPQSLEGLYQDIQEMGQATRAEKTAAALVTKMKADVADVERTVASEPKATAFVEIGYNPLFAVGPGTLMGELVERGGGTNVVEQQGYVSYSTEQLLEADPEVYFATKGTMGDPGVLQKRGGFKTLQAVKANRIALLDDNLVTRPGPRIVEGLEQVARALHPNAFDGQ